MDDISQASLNKPQEQPDLDKQLYVPRAPRIKFCPEWYEFSDRLMSIKEQIQLIELFCEQQ